MTFPAYLPVFFSVLYCTSVSEAAPEPCTVYSSSLDKNHIELISPKDALMTHEHGTEIRVKCKRKFRRRGSLSAFCDDGVMKYQRCFSGSTCHLDQEQMDDNFLELDDKHDGESLYGEGETVQFICKAGYFNRTPLTATCGKPAEPKSVSAEPKLVYPTCIRFGQSCGPPPSVQNGEIIGVKDLKYPSGSIVNYKCANWYILEGKAITCRHGEWDAKPVCRAPCIVRPTDMLQNNIWLKHALPEDKSKKIYSLHFDNITFECTPGYDIPDEKSLRIQCLDGVLKYPTCLKEGFCIIQQHEMVLNDIQYSKGTVIENGQLVVFECAKGMVPLNSLESKCEKRHINYPKCISTTSCIVRPTDMLQNNIWLKHALPEDKRKGIYSLHFDNITFECTPGYDIPDGKSLRIQCLDGVLKYPTCLKEGFCVIQQHEMALNHIRYSKGAVIENGQSVVFECAEGMVPLNSLEGKCERRHINYPKCVSTTSCIVRPTDMLQNNIWLKHALPEDKRKGIYSLHFDNITFECTPGYDIPDEKSLRIQCLDGVLKYPTCLKEGFCVIQQHEMALNHIRYSKGTVIENGQSVVFECAEGMVPLNSLEGKCERRHINYPKCVSTRYGESCGPPPTILSGDIADTKKPSYQSGSSVKYKCANFYVLEGNEFVTCTDGEWGKEPTCRAPCTVTTSTMLANNIRLKFMFEEDKTKKIYVSHLDQVTFECAPGYNILDAKNLRIQCLDGVVTYPKCL
ncbi:complement factor H-like isoform X2 [Rana temporaria]|uniref:complement factor H-like isoform X2 n=1 Tax=Rana temporaria TaxID=8407 RepID=UPI001AACF69B|nr:complement factor H-like isoform X2 [Rana temporaria]